MLRSTPLLALLCLATACVPAHRPPAPPPAPPQPTPPRLPVEQVPVAESAPPPFEAKRVVPNARESAGGTYTVVAGDTLRRVSNKTGAASEAIARENHLAPPFIIRIGQKLRIPAGRWHQVRAGETGIAIARAYGVEWSRIAALNKLEEPYILRTGQRLLLPSTQEVATMTLEERARAFQLDIGDLITGGEPAIAENAAPERPHQTSPREKPLAPDVAVAAARPFDGHFIWPVSGKVVRDFGSFGLGRRNDGIDIAAPVGTPIEAAADGVVAYAGTGIAAYGGLILIRHSDRWTTAYGHAGELLVTRGQAVKRGQIIARAGQSGLTDRPELHFEIRDGAKPVDPLTRLPKKG
ncbi:MAG TPA: M23 family metallopeptidase [Sphingomonadaceae bacterium]|nr:M23 family metallopeptidase [Sphingomonadaceae bacterium]